MWCKRCQQDVPGIAATDTGRLGCPRCGHAFNSGPVGPVAAEQAAEAADTPYDGWELDEQLRHIHRVLEAGKGPHRQPAAQSLPGSTHAFHRVDGPHGGPAAWHVQPAGTPARVRKQAGASGSGALTWSALSLGTMALVCGGILLGWSMATGRQQLWTIGLPIALGGQIVLLVGLILQLDRLWHDSRNAASKLDNVDAQLHQLKTTTTLLGTSHHSSAAAFYSHLASGAGPELLLNDLKSQLDLLALKLSMNDES